MTSIAIILVDLEQGRFGHAARLLDVLAGKPVLQHTLDRVARIEGLDGIVLLHPQAQGLAGQCEVPDGAPPVSAQPMQTRPGDDWLRGVIDAGRKWSLTAWRGGIGGATVYDELLPAYPIACAAQAAGAESAVVLRGDWCCVDPELATKQLKLHRSAPEAMKVAFSQAPPGLSPLVIHHSVLQEMVEHSVMVSNLLCYNPHKPAIDPVGKDVNVPVPASVRDQYRRFIYDTPRAIEHLKAIADRLDDAGDQIDRCGALGLTDVSRSMEIDEPWRQFERTPQQFTVELSPRRAVNGPIVPQHHLDLGRADMSSATIDALLEQLPEAGDVSVIFGGLGDPLLHDAWFETLERALWSGLLGVAVETDLQVESDVIDRLASLPLDAISVRMNADSAETYAALMGIDHYAQLLDNLQRLFQARNRSRREGTGFAGWIVPRFVKVSENLGDMETFFERWMQVSGWAVIDRALTGRGLIPEMGPVPMEVPRPPGRPLRLQQQKQRLTVLSDGRVTLCGQDWLGRQALGLITDRSIGELWRGAGAVADAAVDTSAVCPTCAQWLEARQQLSDSAAV